MDLHPSVQALHAAFVGQAAMFRDDISLGLLRFPAAAFALATALAGPLCRAQGIRGRVFHLVGNDDDCRQAIDLARSFYRDEAQCLSLSELAELEPSALIGGPASTVVLTGEDASAAVRQRALDKLTARWTQSGPAPIVIAASPVPWWTPGHNGHSLQPWLWLSELDVALARSSMRVTFTRRLFGSVLDADSLIEAIELTDGRLGKLWRHVCLGLAAEFVELLRDPSRFKARCVSAMFGVTDADSLTPGLFAPVAAARWATQLGLIGWPDEAPDLLARAFIGDPTFDHIALSNLLVMSQYPSAPGIQ